MIVSINQPAYLPWLGYFHRIALSDAHVVLDHVQFEKNSYTNRNKIRTADGWQWVTIPLKTKGRFGNLQINQVEIDNTQCWARKHWAALYNNYRKAPYFSRYADFFEDLYGKEWMLLNDLLRETTSYLLEACGIHTKIYYSGGMAPAFRKDELVLELVRKLGGTAYLSGQLGKDYLKLEKFDQFGIKVSFQEYVHPEYRQCYPGFEGSMGIVDLLFNYGPETLDMLLSKQGTPCGVAEGISVLSITRPVAKICRNQSILIRADASPAIGTGHVMRMLALGQALKDAGGTVTLATAGTPDSLISRCASEGIRVVRMEAPHPLPQDVSETLALAHECGANWIVLDGYHFDATYQKQVRQAGYALLVVDDYAHHMDYDADLLLNQNIGANELPYTLPPYARTLFGLPFVMLRREFRHARETRKPVREEAQRVLVTLGGGDEHNVTRMVLDALALLVEPPLIVDVVVGAVYTHLVALELQLASFPHEVHLHINTDNMPGLMQMADVAISGAGSTCWELATIGVPTCTVTLAENQQAIARELNQMGAMLSLGWYHELERSRVAAVILGLLHSPGLRQQLSSRSLSLVDGAGCDRILDYMSLWAMDHLSGLRLCPAWFADARRLWQWVNEPTVRKGSFMSVEILWDLHEEWFKSKLHSENSQIWIAFERENKAIGQVRYDYRNGEAEVDISVDINYRGHGFAKTMLRLSLGLVAKRWPVKTVRARIKSENLASINCFLSAGFEETETCVIRGQSARQFLKSVNGV